MLKVLYEANVFKRFEKCLSFVKIHAKYEPCKVRQYQPMEVHSHKTDDVKANPDSLSAIF